MTFPTTTVNTSNLDSATDDPSLARVDLLDAVNKLNEIISNADAAYGVGVLDGSGYIKSNQIPPTISVSGTMTLSPVTSIVNIQSILRLTSQTETAIVAVTGAQEGDIMLCGNLLTSGANVGGIAFYTGSSWVGLPWTANVFVALS